ncbi:MgtC/SapB family protein [Seohaeicola zhoushanensis]|uniref:Protein MgtC n=1 Tax=Seohaeicola zhoushanensis TaxID=1569283 RepID=A0A8J3M6J0_9RHOB|nr:MgtC/SapB family protein [Seohaeicola zhoushanensis]GHF43429.1 magnesium transporter MgtC [Seohaeicola zhoushanensis]
MVDDIIEELTGGFSVVPVEASAIRLGVALLLGAVIGVEREASRKPAGLRTHMLISMAACLFILVSQNLATLQFGDRETMRVDPLRLVEAVTAGVAFLGAGTIFASGGRVKNVTTGASMWLAGAIGLACGAGQEALAALATVLVVTILMLLGWLEKRMGWRDVDD